MLVAFDDKATLEAALAFEAALARAEAAEKLIPAAAAAAIVRACATIAIDAAELADETALAGTLAIPLVARLRQVLADDPAVAKAVHHGATSQDLADTVLMSQARVAVGLLDADLARLAAALSPLAERYGAVPAIGRTLLQDALPIGFGLRIAQWLAGIASARARLAREAATAVALQLGGAAGTRAGLAGKGQQVAARMAAELGLVSPPGPWHSRRDGVAGLATALGIAIGAMAKMARDVALLAQNAIGEAREPAVPGRGGSSAMAHKRNPTGCGVALAAAVRAPGLVAGVLAGMAQEEERGLGGWQAEGPALAELFMLAAGAAEAMACVAEGLDIDDAAIARNLAQAGLGHDIGESQAIVAALIAAYRSSS
ncbi:lyase family protein [Chelatococcus reniformis]|uniref:3-carboxy-cis,cis-muconate cycloisomerase n=1 Tax=Chelatococcus reniformis TaxID=1494448 RepID=A0A916TXK3_9HYPH|nr:lyase family protein [Chelatococcus reniformis]GGC47113.1 3-carboxy-cis,cis-muconate cycloisomerase [Chelatococcus reniformis]